MGADAGMGPSQLESRRVSDSLAIEAPARPTPSRREWQFQQLAWVFLQKALPREAECLGIDEAAKRSSAANLARHARGCLGGPGDIYILHDGTTLWLELKDKSSQRERQKAFQAGVERNRGHYVKVKTLEDIEAACLAAGIPLRATLGEIRGRIAEQNERLPVKRKRAARGFKADNSMSMAQYRRGHGKGLF